MNLRTLFKDVQSGGFTYSLEMGNMANTPFFAISLPNNEINLGVLPTESEFLNALAKIIKAMADNGSPSLAIGGWINKEGEVVLDLTELVPVTVGLEEAIRMGRERNQEAIFNLDAMMEYKLQQHGVAY